MPVKPTSRSRRRAESVPAGMPLWKAFALRDLPERTWGVSFTYIARGRYYSFYEYEEIESTALDGPAYLASVTSDLLRLEGVPDHKRPVIYLDGFPVDPLFTSGILVPRDFRVIDAVRHAREKWLEKWI